MHTLLTAQENNISVPFKYEGDCGSYLIKVTVLEDHAPMAGTLSEKEKYTLAAHGTLSKDAMELAETADIMSGGRVLDVDFINKHTSGLDAFEMKVRVTPWEEIERASSLSREDIEAKAAPRSANRI